MVNDHAAENRKQFVSLHLYYITINKIEPFFFLLIFKTSKHKKIINANNMQIMTKLIPKPT